MTKIIHHKCNTIAMLKDSLTNGSHGVEFDVILTKDNIPVLFHDRVIGDKVVEELTLKQLQKLNSNIPTLMQALYAVKDISVDSNFIFHLEIKQFFARAWDEVNAILKAFPKIDAQTVPRSFQENIISYIKHTSNRPVCLLIGNLSDYKDTDFVLSGKTEVKVLPTVRQIKNICDGAIPEYVSVDYKLVTKEFVQNMHDANIAVDVYTLNDIYGLGLVLVDAIVTDKPSLFLNNYMHNLLNANKILTNMYLKIFKVA